MGNVWSEFVRSVGEGWAFFWAPWRAIGALLNRLTGAAQRIETLEAQLRSSEREHLSAVEDWESSRSQLIRLWYEYEKLDHQSVPAEPCPDASFCFFCSGKGDRVNGSDCSSCGSTTVGSHRSVKLSGDDGGLEWTCDACNREAFPEKPDDDVVCEYCSSCGDSYAAGKGSHRSVNCSGDEGDLIWICDECDRGVWHCGACGAGNEPDVSECAECELAALGNQWSERFLPLLPYA